MQKIETNFERKSIFFISAILIFILFVFALYYDRAEIFKLYTDTTIIDTADKNEALTSTDYNIAGKDSTEQNVETSTTKPLSNYTNSFLPPAPNTDFDVNNYRYYLLNVNLLIFNFLQDQNYDKQLQAIERIFLPSEIQNILTDLKIYNNDYLLSKIDSKETIFPTNNYLWLGKFIKIEKKSPAERKREKLHTTILAKLEFFINFFYSEKFKDEFVK